MKNVVFFRFFSLVFVSLLSFFVFFLCVFNGNSMDIVSYYRYLGIMFTPKLVWTKTESCQVSKKKFDDIK